MNNKIKNERLKKDIETRLDEFESKLTLGILSSIEENGDLEPLHVKKIAQKILEQRGNIKCNY